MDAFVHSYPVETFNRHKINNVAKKNAEIEQKKQLSPLALFSPVLRIRLKTEIFNHISTDIDNNWVNMPQKHKEAFTYLAYDFTDFDPHKRNPVRVVLSYIELIYFVLSFFFIFRGKLSDINDYVRAVENLVDSILSSIERDNPDYQQALLVAIENSDKSQEIPYGSEDEWLDKIFSEDNG